MKSRLRLLIAALCLMVPLMVPATPALAADVLGACNQSTDGGASAGGTEVCNSAGSNPTDPNGNPHNPVLDAIKVAINILSYAVGIASVIIIIVSALRMTLHGGDSQAVSRARSGLIYAVVGIIIVIISQSLVLFVLDKIN